MKIPNTNRHVTRQGIVRKNPARIKTEIVIDSDSISIIQNGKEAVYWDINEWAEDPNVVFPIANAIKMACEGKDIAKIIRRG